MSIGRTLFWFQDGREQLLEMNEKYFALGVLLNRLLNQKYAGRRIEFINIDFSTARTYDENPGLPRNEPYYYNGHLRYYGLIDLGHFSQLDEEQRKIFVWDQACVSLSAAAESIRNKKLAEACSSAQTEGRAMGLNPDYRMVEADITVSGQLLRASVWVNFREAGMFSKFTLEREQEVVFERDIDSTKHGVELFLEMYTGIELQNGDIVITGRNDIDYLPLRLPLSGIAVTG